MSDQSRPCGERTEINRRRLLEAAAVLGAGGLAGCSGNSGGQTSEAEGTDSYDNSGGTGTDTKKTQKDTATADSASLEDVKLNWNELLAHPNDMYDDGLVDQRLTETYQKTRELSSKEAAETATRNLTEEYFHVIDLTGVSGPDWDADGKMIVPSVTDFSWDQCGPEIFAGPWSYGATTVPSDVSNESFAQHLREKYGDPEEISGLMAFTGEFDNPVYQSLPITSGQFMMGVDPSGGSRMVPFATKHDNRENIVGDLEGAYEKQSLVVRGEDRSLGTGNTHIDEDFKTLISFYEEHGGDVAVLSNGGDPSSPAYRNDPFINTLDYRNDGFAKSIRTFMDPKNGYSTDPLETSADLEELKVFVERA